MSSSSSSLSLSSSPLAAAVAAPSLLAAQAAELKTCERKIHLLDEQTENDLTNLIEAQRQFRELSKLDIVDRAADKDFDDKLASIAAEVAALAYHQRNRRNYCSP